MEEAGAGELLAVNIIGAEGVVGPGAVEEDAVHAGGADDDGVGAGRALLDDHALSELGCDGADDVHDCSSDEVVADLSHEPAGNAEAVEREAGVGDGAAGGGGEGPHVGELAGAEEGVEGDLGVSEGGNDIEADVPGDDDVGLPAWQVARLLWC